jgi:hypothetical protein
MSNGFNLQQYLEAMEGRIRADIVDVREDHKATRELQISLEGRVKSLEEKAGWIGAGIATSIVGVFGLALAYVKDSLGAH